MSKTLIFSIGVCSMSCFNEAASARLVIFESAVLSPPSAVIMMIYIIITNYNNFCKMLYCCHFWTKSLECPKK